MRRVWGLVLASAAFGCAPGSVYDDLSGGRPVGGGSAAPSLTSEAKQDESLAPPRPVAPISVSAIATARPSLRWENTSGATGAVVEMSQSRKFPPEATKTFELDGDRGEVPEQLASGMWFWRLKSRAPGRLGTKTSPIWQMYLRGPMKTGAAAGPTGTVLDWDGDGLADLATVGDETIPDDTGDGFLTAPVLYVIPGLEDGTFGYPTPVAFFDGSPLGGAATLAGGMDVDGDGFADLAHNGLVTVYEGDDGSGPPPSPRPPDAVLKTYISGVMLGGASQADQLREMALPYFEDSKLVTPLVSAGDVDGDGYGDIFHVDQRVLGVVHGAPKTLQSVTPLFRNDVPMIVPMTGGFDVNGDGSPDLVHAGVLVPDHKKRAQLVMGGSELERRGQSLVPQLDGAYEVRAVASGDFDGNGVSDVALGTKRTDNGTFAVCVFFGAKGGAMQGGSCSPSGRPDTDWASVMTVVDLDGDGRDELLVSGTDPSGVRIEALHFDPSLTFFETIDRGTGTVLTTIYPGAVGKPGRWAATPPTLDAIHVYTGFERTQTITTPYAKSFGRALR